MTQNQIAWLAHLENVRHNREDERLQFFRTTSGALETRRHNVATERLESRSIADRTRLGNLQFMETVRSNRANENIRRYDTEVRANHLRSELEWRNKDTSLRYITAQNDIAFKKYKAKLDTEVAYANIDMRKSVSTAEIAQRDRQLAVSALSNQLEIAARRYNTDVLDRISLRKFELGLRNLISSERIRRRELDLREAKLLFDNAIQASLAEIKLNDSLSNRDYQRRMALVEEGKLSEQTFHNRTERYEHESQSDYRKSSNIQRGFKTIADLVSLGVKMFTPLL